MRTLIRISEYNNIYKWTGRGFPPCFIVAMTAFLSGRYCLCCPSLIGPIRADELIEALFISVINCLTQHSLSLTLLSKLNYPLPNVNWFVFRNIHQVLMNIKSEFFSAWSNLIRNFVWYTLRSIVESGKQTLTHHWRRYRGDSVGKHVLKPNTSFSQWFLCLMAYQPLQVI